MHRRVNMAQAVKPKPKTATKKQVKGKRAGNARKQKPSAPMTMIATPEAMLAFPLGEIPANLSRFDLDAGIVYPVSIYTPAKGKYFGKKVPQLLITTPDGIEHELYPDVGFDLGQAIEHNPKVVLDLIAYSRDVASKIVRGKQDA
jgi:hypothetical protein